MEQETHKRAAEIHYEIAVKHHNLFISTISTEKKANMVVASQNYFYCIINFVEMIFAKTNEHSFNHENRHRKIAEKSDLFSTQFKGLFEEVDRNLRNKVAYKGENGDKYAVIKELAELSMKELRKNVETKDMNGKQLS
ncbi:hypothetical protein HY636_03320 [Candidatus Woesearchaeota archaeon]|nr:hypothetical protein [Candidatus Woesearchaeota archaeon]